MRERSTTSSSASRVEGLKLPTRSTNTPRFSQRPSNTGVLLVVAQVTMSADPTASSTDCAAVTSTWLATSERIAFTVATARSCRRPQMLTREMGRAVQ
jgi:hypothetical protein